MAKDLAKASQGRHPSVRVSNECVRLPFHRATRPSVGATDPHFTTSLLVPAFRVVIFFDFSWKSHSEVAVRLDLGKVQKVEFSSRVVRNVKPNAWLLGGGGNLFGGGFDFFDFSNALTC